MRQLIAGLFLAVVIVVAAVLLWPSGGSQGIVLYSALDSGQAVAKAFTAKTGIAVHVSRLPTGGLLARVPAEGHHPDWTVAWFDGATAAVLLDRAAFDGDEIASASVATEIRFASEADRAAFLHDYVEGLTALATRHGARSGQRYRLLLAAYPDREDQ